MYMDQSCTRLMFCICRALVMGKGKARQLCTPRLCFGSWALECCLTLVGAVFFGLCVSTVVVRLYVFLVPILASPYVESGKQCVFGDESAAFTMDGLDNSYLVSWTEVFCVCFDWMWFYLKQKSYVLHWQVTSSSADPEIRGSCAIPNRYLEFPDFCGAELKFAGDFTTDVFCSQGGTNILGGVCDSLCDSAWLWFSKEQCAPLNSVSLLLWIREILFWAQFVLLCCAGEVCRSFFWEQRGSGALLCVLYWSHCALIDRVNQEYSFLMSFLSKQSRAANRPANGRPPRGPTWPKEWCATPCSPPVEVGNWQFRFPNFANKKQPRASSDDRENNAVQIDDARIRRERDGRVHVSCKPTFIRYTPSRASIHVKTASIDMGVDVSEIRTDIERVAQKELDSYPLCRLPLGSAYSFGLKLADIYYVFDENSDFQLVPFCASRSRI